MHTAYETGEWKCALFLVPCEGEALLCAACFISAYCVQKLS